MLNEIVGACARFCACLFPFDCMDAVFMQYAMLELLMVAPLAALCGIPVVNGRMSFFSDAIGHSAFAGVAIGLIFGISVRLSMPAIAVLVGLSVMMLKRGSRLSSDTVIGVIFSAVAAFGLAIVSRDHTSTSANIQMFLFGDILVIDAKQIVLTALLLLLFGIFNFFAFNRMLLIGINPVLAAVHRIRVSAYQYIFAALLSLVVIGSVRAAGVILVTALLVIPSAAARNFAWNASSMFYISLAISYVSCISGLLISAQEWADIPAGSAIVLVSVVFFFISMIVSLLRLKREGDSAV